MKKINLLLLSAILLLSQQDGFSQQKTGEVYLVRATGYVGSAVNFKVYLDDTLVCKLKNKHYSIHTVPVGKHFVSAKSAGISNGKKSQPFEIEVKEGQITYVDIAWANKVYCQEITAASAAQTLQRAKKIASCSTVE